LVHWFTEKSLNLPKVLSFCLEKTITEGTIIADAGKIILRFSARESRKSARILVLGYRAEPVNLVFIRVD
jgi:hypothetical protein